MRSKSGDPPAFELDVDSTEGDVGGIASSSHGDGESAPRMSTRTLSTPITLQERTKASIAQQGKYVDANVCADDLDFIADVPSTTDAYGNNTKSDARRADTATLSKDVFNVTNADSAKVIAEVLRVALNLPSAVGPLPRDVLSAACEQMPDFALPNEATPKVALLKLASTVADQQRRNQKEEKKRQKWLQKQALKQAAAAEEAAAEAKRQRALDFLEGRSDGGRRSSRKRNDNRKRSEDATGNNNQPRRNCGESGRNHATGSTGRSHRHQRKGCSKNASSNLSSADASDKGMPVEHKAGRSGRAQHRRRGRGNRRGQGKQAVQPRNGAAGKSPQ